MALAKSDITLNFLTCQVCLDMYKTPRILPCIHSFCHDCLQQCMTQCSNLGGATFPCPICREETAITTDGKASSFKMNFFLQNLCDALSPEQDVTQVCENCTEGITAEYQCTECHNLLCEECVQAHKRTRLTKSHQILTLIEVASGKFVAEIRERQKLMCDEHDETMKIFCTDCKLTICCNCKVTRHNDHKAVAIRDQIQEDSRVLHNHLDRVQVRLTTLQFYLQNLETYRGETTENKCKTEEALTEREIQLNSIVRKHMVKLTEKLVQITDNEETEIMSYRDLITKHVSSLKQVADFTKQLLKSGTDGEILTIYPELLFKLKRLQSIPCADIIHKQRLHVLFDSGDLDERKVAGLCGNVISRNLGSVFTAQVKKGIHITSFDTSSVTDERSAFARSMAITYDNMIVVLDQNNHKVKMFSTSGGLTGEFSIMDKTRHPLEVGVISDGKIAILDESKGIRLYSRSGRYISCLNTHTTAPFGFCTYHEKLLVTDRKQKNITVISQNGDFEAIIPSNQSRLLFQKPCAIVTNKSDNIIVADVNDHCIKVISGHDGHLLAGYGTKGSGCGQLNLPISVCVDEHENVLVADYYNSRVQLLTKEMKFVMYVVDHSDGVHRPTCVIVDNAGLLLVAGVKGAIHAYRYIN